jgi:hypothetical protein
MAMRSKRSDSSVRSAPYVTGSEAKDAKAATKAKKQLGVVPEERVEAESTSARTKNPTIKIIRTLKEHDEPLAAEYTIDDLKHGGFTEETNQFNQIYKNDTFKYVDILLEPAKAVPLLHIHIFFFNKKQDKNGKKYKIFNEKPSVKALTKELFQYLDPKLVTDFDIDNVNIAIFPMGRFNRGGGNRIDIFKMSNSCYNAGFYRCPKAQDNDIVDTDDMTVINVESSASEGGFKKRRVNRRTKTRKSNRRTRKTRTRKTIKRKYSKKY